MSTASTIEWTDATWNPVRGCDEISPGCQQCYAKAFAERFRGVAGHPYEQGFDLRLVPSALDLPKTWRKARRIFVNSMSDLFHEGVPDDFIRQVFEVMRACPQHTFQVLTKRAARLAKLAPSLVWSPNVWMGVSVESQRYADERLPELVRIGARVRFVSCEPLLDEVDLRPWLRELQWVIVGGESGRRARMHEIGWTRSIVQQCAEAGVPVFVKQLGALPVLAAEATGKFRTHKGKRQVQLAVTRLPLVNRKGGDPSEWPPDLRVRQYPEVV